MKIEENIYSMFKKNNLTLWLVIGLAAISVVSSFVFCFVVYKQSQENLFGITEKGVLVPLEKLDSKRDKIKQVKANLDYFVSLYYDMDGFTMKEKKEKIFWLLGKQPAGVVNDRDEKGYFNDFLSINGLVQHAVIDQNSWQLYRIDEPYKLAFKVSLIRMNNGSKNYYTSDVVVELKTVNRNYPYNPYGLLITSFSENLRKIDKSDFTAIQKNNQIEKNQND